MGGNRFLVPAILATTLLASAAFAAPARPLIVLFAPDGVKGGDDNADALVSRGKQTTLALRDAFNDTGIVDAVVYSPENALFVRAVLEAKLKLADPASPTPSERFALAKAAGATYAGILLSGLPSNTSPGNLDVELQTEQVDGRRTWRGRSSFGVSGRSAGKYDNAVLSAANSLVQEFLRGPLKELAQVTAPSLPPPIPTVRETPSPAQSMDVPSLALPAPMTAPIAPVAPVIKSDPLPSSGADTDSAAEAQRHQGDEQTRAGDAAGAILSYRKAVNLSPLNPTYRASLAGAYLMAGRSGDAVSEAKRAFSVVPVTDQKNKIAVSKLLAAVLLQSGDTATARSTYEGLLKAEPGEAWAMIGLAEVLQNEGKTDEAIALYKKARQNGGDAKEVSLGIARLLAVQGEYDAALKELTAASGGRNDAVRYETVRQLFDDGVTGIAERVEQNRAAWEAKRIARDVYYKATAAQTAKVSGLAALLKAMPPVGTADAQTKRNHAKRIFAANLLLQGVASLLTQVETGDANAGSEATVFLSEFRHEAQDIGMTPRPAAPGEK